MLACVVQNLTALFTFKLSHEKIKLSEGPVWSLEQVIVTKLPLLRLKYLEILGEK